MILILTLPWGGGDLNSQNPLSKTDKHSNLNNLSENLSNLSNADFFIAHAGGGLMKNGEIFTYTNSKEALLQSINEGFKFIELDLMLDEDGEIFAAHDYEHFYRITGAKFDDKNASLPPSKAYLANARIYGYFTPLNARDINEIFNQNPSVYLVTDKLDDFKAFAMQFDFKDRLLVEVFSTRDYFKARKMGLKYPMFCVEDSTEALETAMRLKIPMITAHTKLLQHKSGEKLARKYIQNGGCIMMFSSNEKAFTSKHKGKSATKFYTDFYDIKADKCKLDEKECKTY